MMALLEFFTQGVRWRTVRLFQNESEIGLIEQRRTGSLFPLVPMLLTLIAHGIAMARHAAG
jgi:hypothetical protein